MSYKTNRSTRGKFRTPRIIKITDPIDKRLDYLLRTNSDRASKVHPVDRNASNAFALISVNGEEQYSANPHDYFMSSDDHVFTDSEGIEMGLWWMGYTDDGDYLPFALLQDYPITTADLRRLSTK